MKAAKGVPKTGENAHFRYKFSSIEDVINAVRPAMIDNGLALYPIRIDSAMTQNELSRCDVQVTYQIAHTSGATAEILALGSGLNNSAKDDKAANKALTSAHKNALIQLFCLPRGDDQDYGGQSKPEPPPEPVPLLDREQFMGRIGGLGGPSWVEDYKCLVAWCASKGWPPPDTVSEQRRNKFCTHITQVETFESLEAFAKEHFGHA